MSVELKRNGEKLHATAPVSIVEQLDVELDSGNARFLRTEKENSSLFAPLSTYEIAVDGTKFNFVGTDSRALVCKTSADGGIYSHDLSLTEPSKLLQGVLIDGFAVSQPEEENNRVSLFDVLKRLLSVTPFDEPMFELTTNSAVTGVLRIMKSPEFRWNAQTTLWECLLQIAAVIDAMPRLVEDETGNLRVISFDFINASAIEVESIEDGRTNTTGQRVDESQYNSALSTIVDNLSEA